MSNTVPIHKQLKVHLRSSAPDQGLLNFWAMTTTETCGNVAGMVAQFLMTWVGKSLNISSGWRFFCELLSLEIKLHTDSWYCFEPSSEFRRGADFLSRKVLKAALSRL